MNEKFKKVALLAGVMPEGTDEELAAALELKLATIESLVAFKAAAETAAVEAQKAKVVELLDTAVANKKIGEAEKPLWAKLLALDFDAAKASLEAIKAVPSIQAQMGVAAPSAKDSWTLEQWRKADPKGLALMKANDAERYNTLYKAEYQK